MDFQELIRRCKKNPQVKSVSLTDNGVEIVVRMNITVYDPDGLSRVLNNQKTNLRTKAVLSRLPELEQEHKFLVCNQRVEAIMHTSPEAFGNPFVDLGCFTLDMRHAIENSDYNELINLMICETRSFNVLDAVMVERLVEWAYKANKT